MNTHDEKMEHLWELYQKWKECDRCPLAHPTGRHRTNVVFGEGNADAKVVIIGGTPAEAEDLSGRPFSGREGEIIDDLLKSCNSSRDEVFLLNITGCRSTEDSDSTRDRKPDKAEVSACMPRVHEILYTIDPYVVLLLGATALKALTKEKKGIKALAQDQHFPQVSVEVPGKQVPISWPAFATFHPAYLLQNWSLDSGGDVHLAWQVWQKAFKVADVYNEQYRGVVPPQRENNG
jgi:DNA polymerase